MTAPKTHLTNTADLTAMVETLVDRYMTRDGEGFATSVPVVSPQTRTVRLDARFHGYSASITLALDVDGALDVKFLVRYGRGGYNTILLPEHATAANVIAHADRAVQILSEQVADAEKRERERDQDIAAGIGDYGPLR